MAERFRPRLPGKITYIFAAGVFALSGCGEQVKYVGTYCRGGDCSSGTATIPTNSSRGCPEILVRTRTETDIDGSNLRKVTEEWQLLPDTCVPVLPRSGGE